MHDLSVPLYVNLEGHRTTVLRRVTVVTDWFQVTVRRDSRLPLGLLVRRGVVVRPKRVAVGCRTHFHRFLLVRGIHEAVLPATCMQAELVTSEAMSSALCSPFWAPPASKRSFHKTPPGCNGLSL